MKKLVPNIITCCNLLSGALAVMLAVEKRTGDSTISFIEFATQVQTSNPEGDIEKVVDSILEILGE